MEDTNYKLRGWMGSNRVSGVEMAERIGMPYDTFKGKYSGKTEWKLSEIKALIEATSTTFEELF